MGRGDRDENEVGVPSRVGVGGEIELDLEPERRHARGDRPNERRVVHRQDLRGHLERGDARSELVERGANSSPM
jgi:hypothetical protein